MKIFGDAKEVKEQPSVTGFDPALRRQCQVATEVRAKIDDCVPKSKRKKDKCAVALFENWGGGGGGLNYRIP